MDKTDRLIERFKQARIEALTNPPKKLASKYRHYTTKMTKADRDIRYIEKINRAAPVKIIKKGKV